MTDKKFDLDAIEARQQSLPWPGEVLDERVIKEIQRDGLALVAEVRRLKSKLEIAEAKAAVWSSEACKKRQEAGTGPCGTCCYCLSREVIYLRNRDKMLEKVEAWLDAEEAHYNKFPPT